MFPLILLVMVTVRKGNWQEGPTLKIMLGFTRMQQEPERFHIAHYRTYCGLHVFHSGRRPSLQINRQATAYVLAVAALLKVTSCHNIYLRQKSYGIEFYLGPENVEVLDYSFLNPERISRQNHQTSAFTSSVILTLFC